jgi:hypothetical protein
MGPSIEMQESGQGIGASGLPAAVFFCFVLRLSCGTVVSALLNGSRLLFLYGSLLCSRGETGQIGQALNCIEQTLL